MPEFPDIQPYLKSICDRYQKWWQLYTLTDAAGKERQSKSELQSPFDFGLMVQTVSKENRDPRNEEKGRIERFPVLEGIRKYAKDHVLLVGRPGAGKSTALARLLLEEATQQTSLPVLVELRYWQGSIEQLILNSLARHELPLTAEQLETVLSRSLILFDGVNESPSDEARNQLSAFRRNHPKVPMIFTTRDLSLGGDLGIEKKLEMQPLTEAQMQAFIRSYVPEQAEQMLRQLKDRLRELGQTPLLLWMLCQLFQQTGEIPDNLGMVFRLFTQGYERNLKQDVVIESDRAWWKPVLQQLAWVMMQGEKPTEFRVAISREEAVKAIAQFLDKKVPYAEDFARKCLRDLQKHHLIQAGTNQEELEFRHQLIQEYYAAEALLNRLDRLEDDQLKREFLNFLKWTEPIELMLALLEETRTLQVISQALEVDLVLGGRVIRSSKVRNVQELKNIIENAIPSQAVRYWFLGIAELDVDTPSLIKALESENVQIRNIATNTLLQISPLVASVYNLSGLLEAKKLLNIQHILHIQDIPISLNQNAIDNNKIFSLLEQLSILRAVDKTLKKLDEKLNFNICIDIADTVAVLSCHFDSQLIYSVLKVYRELRSSFQEKEISVMCNRLVELECEDIVPDFLVALKSTEIIDDQHFESVFTKIRSSKCLVDSLAELAGSRAFESILLNILDSLQKYCKYYNYEIYQAYLEAQKVDRQQSQTSDRSNPIIVNGDYIVGDKIEGDKVQGNKTEAPKATEVKIFENVDRYYEAPPS